MDPFKAFEAQKKQKPTPPPNSVGGRPCALASNAVIAVIDDLEGYDNDELEEYEKSLCAAKEAQNEFERLVHDALTPSPPAPPTQRGQCTLNKGSAAWRTLHNEHPELVAQMCADYTRGAYTAVSLKYEEQLRILGFAVPPQQSWSRWVQNIATNQPARLVQGGHRRSILSEEELAKLETTLEGVRDAGGKIGWRLLQRLATCLLAIGGRVYRSGANNAVFPSISWCCTFFSSRGFVTRRKTQASRRVKPADFDVIQRNFVLQVAYNVAILKLSKGCVANFDETGVFLFKQGDSTMAQRGVKQVPMFGAGEKRQFTVTNCGAANGDMPPLQVIFQGKEGKKGAVPKFEGAIPGMRGALLTQTNSHWQTTDSMLEYMEVIFLPWITEQRRNAGDPNGYFLLLVDVFSAHLTVTFRQWCHKHRIRLQFIYPGLTGDLQPMDIAIQGPFKDDITTYMEEYYSSLLTQYMEENNGSWNGFEFGMRKKDLALPFLKAVGKAYNHMCTSKIGLTRRLSAWRQFEVCWDILTQAEAIQRFNNGTLYSQTQGGKRSKVVVVEAIIRADALATEKDLVEEALEERNVEGDVLVGPQAHSRVGEVLKSDGEEAESDNVDVEMNLGDDGVDEMQGGNIETADYLAECLVRSKATVAGMQYLVHFKNLPRSNDEWWFQEELEEEGLLDLITSFHAEEAKTKKQHDVRLTSKRQQKQKKVFDV